jgi:hypothetical protein
MNPIKVLFDVLDVRSILQCWKALIFDKWVRNLGFNNVFDVVDTSKFLDKPLIHGG